LTVQSQQQQQPQQQQPQQQQQGEVKAQKLWKTPVLPAQINVSRGGLGLGMVGWDFAQTLMQRSHCTAPGRGVLGSVYSTAASTARCQELAGHST
jgi:hypothetical protein